MIEDIDFNLEGEEEWYYPDNYEDSDCETQEEIELRHIPTAQELASFDEMACINFLIATGGRKEIKGDADSNP